MAGASGNVKAGRAFVEIMLDQSKLERGLKEAQRKLRNFGSSLTAVGKSLTAVASMAAVPLALATKTFSDFDDQMRMVRAVTGSTEKEFQRLTATAEKLGRETSFTAKQVAESMVAMGRMGFNAGEIDHAIASVLNLARATGTDLANAAEIATNNMRVFGIQSSQMTEVADILTATANGSAQTLNDLAEGLKMVGPQASAAGDSIVNVSGALGVLANLGIKGSLAGTALRRAYSQFANAGIQNKLKAIGIATVDANGDLRAMPDIMADIAKAMNAMPTAQRLGFAEEIFDLRGSLAGLQLGGNIQQLEAFIARLKSVGGTAKNTAEQMDSGIGGAFRRLYSALEGVQIALGRIIGEAIAPYLDRISKMLNQVAEWCTAHQKLIVVAAKVVVGIGALGVALLTAGVAVKTMSFAVGGLATALAVLKTLALAPVVAIQALIGAFTGLKVVLATVRVVALATWTAISSPTVLLGAALAVVIATVWKLSGAWDACADAVRGLVANFGTAFRNIGNVVRQTWDVIKTALASGDLAGAVKVGLSALRVAWLEGIAPLQTAWFKLKNFLEDSWSITVFSILKVANNLWYGLLIGLKNIGDALQDAWSFLWNGIIDTFEKTFLELQKAWIRTKGLFDSKDKIEVAVAEAEQNYSDRKTEREERSASAVNQRAEERQALSKERDTKNTAIDQAMAAEINDNRKKYDEAVGTASQEIENARVQWQEAMDAVRKNAQERSAQTEVNEKKLESATLGTASVAGNLSEGGRSVGAWSAEELDALLGNGDDAQERTAKATEQIVANTKESNKLIKRLKTSSTTLSYV